MFEAQAGYVYDFCSGRTKLVTSDLLMGKRFFIGLTVLVLCSRAIVPAQEPAEPEQVSVDTDSQAGLAFFESKIRPVLVEHCYECHSTDADASEGGLRVDDQAALRAGGERGPAVVPRRPDASLLLTAISHQDVDLMMPPKEKRLSADVLHNFRKWIEMGAPDPRRKQSSTESGHWNGFDKAATFWAYQVPKISPPPTVANTSWPRSAIDRFILRRLEENHLAPSNDADPQVLLRRIFFDLVGLPPEPHDLDRFQKAVAVEGFDAAVVKEVDQLLESPRFGEHWGRHWLDVARFGESSGKEANIPFPYAWRYRDYVIDSLNADLPINRFLTEQIAGDLLEYESDRERARLLVATGFLAVGTKNLSEGNEKQFQADIIDEQIDSLTRAVIGSSVACARCHDHKFDPFSMRDYYALAGIFASTKTYFGTFVSPASRQGGELIRLPRTEDEVVLHPPVGSEEAKELKQRLAELQAEKAEMDAAQRAIFSGKKPKRVFTLRDVLANIWRTGPIVGKLQIIDEDGRAVPVAMGVKDRNEIVDAPLLSRGEVNRPGEPVPRAFPRVIDLENLPEIPEDESGRLELARWLTDPQHPLTGRVFVNRVWHHLFGIGLVQTVDNFGTTGEPPSHPQLLDTLAVEFVQDGWSLKRLVRRLVLTRVYRQASEYREEAFLQDPDNRLLWRMPKRRLTAEEIRDSMLCVADQLDLSRPRGSLVGRVILDKPISLIGLDKRLPKDLDGSLHRSVYLPVIRDRLPDVLELFDFAEPSLVTGDREMTNVPVQALYLMNSPFVQERAQEFASRLTYEARSDTERIELGFRLCYSRDPDAQERERSLAYLRSRSSESDRPRGESSDRLVSFCQALLSTAEFRNID